MHFIDLPFLLCCWDDVKQPYVFTAAFQEQYTVFNSIRFTASMLDSTFFFFGAMTTEKNTDVIVVCVFFGWFLLLLFSFLVGKFLQFFIMNHRIIATFIEIPQIMNYMPIYCCNQLLSFFSGARFMKYAYDNYLS